MKFEQTTSDTYYICHVAMLGAFFNISITYVDTTNIGRSHDDDNMANVVCPDYIHITHNHTIYTYFYCFIFFNYSK